MGWKYICSEPWNDTKDMVTYHRVYTDCILVIRYLFPKGKKRMPDYQDRVYDRRKIGKGEWQEGRKKPKKRGA